MFNYIRKIAKLWSIISCIFILILIIGYGLDPNEPLPSLIEWLELALFPFGVIVGQLIAWKKEGVGSFITIASIAVFYIIEFVFKGRFPGGPYFMLVAFPGFLFLICNINSKKSNRDK